MGPEEPSDLVVTAGTETPTTLEAAAVTLTAEAAGGEPPYLFRWDQNAGPAEITLADVTTSTATTGPLTSPGRYLFRVVVTDGEGFHATGFVAVEVVDAVTATAPEIAVVGEPVELSATLDPRVGDASVLWEVVRGTASLEGASSTSPRLTTTTGETVEVLLTVSSPSAGDAPATATRSFEIVSVHDLHPRVLVETTNGDFTLEFDGELAPLHTANFLLYVDDGFYDGLLFHRNACTENRETEVCEPFVLQGGGYRRVAEDLEPEKATRDPVASEAENGLTNGVPYSVSLAFTGGDPESGTTQFFINLADNGVLDDQSFTVFGSVSAGREIVDAIAATERTDSPIVPGEVSLPVEDVIIERMSRVNP